MKKKKQTQKRDKRGRFVKKSITRKKKLNKRYGKIGKPHKKTTPKKSKKHDPLEDFPEIDDYLDEVDLDEEEDPQDSRTQWFIVPKSKQEKSAQKRKRQQAALAKQKRKRAEARRKIKQQVERIKKRILKKVKPKKHVPPKSRTRTTRK